MNALEVSALLRNLLELALKLQTVLGTAQREGRDLTPEEVAQARADAVAARDRLVNAP